MVSFSNLIATEIIDLNLCDLILFLYLRSITISLPGRLSRQSLVELSGVLYLTLSAYYSLSDNNAAGCKDGDVVFEDGYEALEGCHGLTCSAGVLDRHIAPTCKSATSLWPWCYRRRAGECSQCETRSDHCIVTFPLSFKAFSSPRLRGGSRGPGRWQHMASRMPQLYMHRGGRTNHRCSRNM